MIKYKRPSWLERLRNPRWRWLRVPVGFALVVGGVFGFLPVVGFWMIPLGLSLLALDFPVARKANRWIRRKFQNVVAWLRRRGFLPREKSE